MAHPPSFLTRAMAKAQKAVGQPLEAYLDEKYRTMTQDQIADDLAARGVRISQAAIRVWLRDCGIEARLPGQRPPEATAVA